MVVYMNILADAPKSTCNAEKHGKRPALICPCLKAIVQSPLVMMKYGHTGEFKIRAGKTIINPTDRPNKYGVTSLRCNAAPRNMEKWVTNLPPSCQHGHIIPTTSGGTMDHEDVRR